MKNDNVEETENVFENEDETKKRTKNDLRIIVYKTVALYFSYFSMGMAIIVTGLTIVHIEYHLETTGETMVFTFFLLFTGFAIGSVICALVFERVNKELAFAAALGGAGTCLALAGLIGNVYGFLGFIMMHGVLLGFADTGTQTYCVNLWEGRVWKMPIMQGLHAIFALGNTIGPFLVNLFLIELHQAADISLPNTTDITRLYPPNISLPNTTVITRSYPPNPLLANVSARGAAEEDSSPGSRLSSSASYTSFVEEMGINITTHQLEGMENVKYAYVMMGSILFAFALPFLMLGIFCRPKPYNKVARKESKVAKKKRNVVRLVFLAILFLFMGVFMYIELLPGIYYVTFVIKELHWSVNDSSILMSLFFGAHLVGRIIGIPISKWVSATKMLLANSALATIAFFLLLAIKPCPQILWASTGIAGLAMASTFATIFIWISEIITLTSAVSSLMVLGACVTSITAPLVFGTLMNKVTPMILIYALVFFSFLQLLILGVLLLFKYKFSNKLKD